MKVNYQSLYENLGYLFYAIADADHHVHKAEEESLKSAINNIWLPMENTSDEFGTDAAHYIYIAFDYLQAEDSEPSVAFQKFKEYYENHSQYFDDTLKKKIMLTADAIADSFAGKNRSEEAYLKKLKQLMKT